MDKTPHYTSSRMTVLVVFGILLISMISPSHLFAQSLGDEHVIELFSVAQKFFRDLQERNYTGLWNAISKGSQKTIVRAIHKEKQNTGRDATIDSIKKDFEQCRAMCRSFWHAYFAAFDPELALKQSRWDVGFVKKRKAEILITHRDADRPAKLKMFREKGEWKVGLMETFWNYMTRKL